MSAPPTPGLGIRTDERASSLRRLASLARTGPPHGGSLPEEVWKRRHRAIVLLLWGHVLGLPLFALIRGYGPVHSLVEGGAVVVFAALASLHARGSTFRSAMAALGLLTSSAVLVHLSGGTIEVHFHFFVVVGVLTLYEDWVPFLVAIGYVVVHHGVIGTLSPETVFNHPAARAHPWTWAAIHGGFVMAAAAAYVVSWRLTEQARARLAESSWRLKESEGRFRGAFERAPIGVALVGLDGSFLRVNGSLCRMLGRSEHELLATTFETITHPDDLERSREAHRQLLAGDIGALYMEKRYIRADGKAFWAQLSASTVYDDQDRPRYRVTHVEDIDQRKRAEAMLRQTERKYRTLVEQVPSVVYTAEYGESGRWYYVSPRIESMLGFTPEEWLADPDLWYERLIPEDRERAMADDARSRTTGEPLRSEYRLLSRHGRVLWVRDEAEAVLDDEGNAVFHHGILVDITFQKEAQNSVERLAVALEERVIERTGELEEANQELRKAKEVAELANRAKSEFLSRMSHELRTPLNAILGFGQLLETSTLSPDDDESVQQILKGGRHLLDLINEVLDIARIESRRMSFSVEPVSVDDVLREVIDLILPLAAERGIELRMDSSDPARFVLADRQRLKQVMLNLVANAVKFNCEGGSVAVFCHHDNPGHLSIWVTDTGPGIAPEDRDRLFFPFDRLGVERAGVEGTGLGLALTKALIEGMNGSIGVESELGRGSTFWVSLPRADAPDTRDEREPLSGRPVPLSLRGRTVLYIEDNPSNHTLMERVLADGLDVRLLTAMQGRMGFDLAQEHSPDLIVLDLHLPDISGEEVLSRLREDPATLETPVIVMSADGSPGQIGRLMSAGASGFLPKPLDLKLFLEAVAEVLGTTRKPRV